MKEFELSMGVEGTYHGKKEQPEIGDFKGELTYHEQSRYTSFDGTFTSKVVASNYEEAVQLFYDEFRKCNAGDLIDVCRSVAPPDVLSVNEKWTKTQTIDLGNGDTTSLIKTNNFSSISNYEPIYNATSDFIYDGHSLSEELLDEAEKVMLEKHSDSYASMCSIVAIDEKVYIEITNEFDDETAELHNLTDEDLYSKAVKKAEEFAHHALFSGTTIIAGENIGVKNLHGKGNHEIIVFVPGDVEKERLEKIFQFIDDNVYEIGDSEIEKLENGLKKAEERFGDESQEYYKAQDNIWDYVNDNAKVIDIVSDEDESHPNYVELHMALNDTALNDILHKMKMNLSSDAIVNFYLQAYSDDQAVLVLELDEKNEIEIPLGSVEEAAYADKAEIFMNEVFGKGIKNYLSDGYKEKMERG